MELFFVFFFFLNNFEHKTWMLPVTVFSFRSRATYIIPSKRNPTQIDSLFLRLNCVCTFSGRYQRSIVWGINYTCYIWETQLTNEFIRGIQNASHPAVTYGGLVNIVVGVTGETWRSFDAKCVKKYARKATLTVINWRVLHSNESGATTHQSTRIIPEVK